MSKDVGFWIVLGLFAVVIALVVGVKVMLRQQRKKYMRGWAEQRGGRYQTEATESLRERLAPAPPFTSRGVRALDVVELRHGGVEITVFDAHVTTRSSQSTQTSIRTVLAARLPQAAPSFICRARHEQEEARQQIASVVDAIGLPRGKLDRGYARVELGEADFLKRWVVSGSTPGAVAGLWTPELTAAIDAQHGARFEVQGDSVLMLPEHSDQYFDEPLDRQVDGLAAVAAALTTALRDSPQGASSSIA
ncbi:MAG: hypothetical protein RIT81_20715 [Deltaproteobacteria bacterium]